jgi:hypothetical protein
MQHGKMRSRKTTTSALSLKHSKPKCKSCVLKLQTSQGEYVQERQQEPARTEYYTHEEELAKETKWIVRHKRNSKKVKWILSATRQNNPAQNNASSSPNMKWLNP